MNFIKKTISELIRITSDEIRIFPIVNLRYQRSSFVDEIIEDSEFKNYQIEISEVDYEFIQMEMKCLKLYKLI